MLLLRLVLIVAQLRKGSEDEVVRLLEIVAVGPEREDGTVELGAVGVVAVAKLFLSYWEMAENTESKIPSHFRLLLQSNVGAARRRRQDSGRGDAHFTAILVLEGLHPQASDVAKVPDAGAPCTLIASTPRTIEVGRRTSEDRNRQ